MSYNEDPAARNPIYGGMSTEHVAGAITIGALVLLILIGRGFRGLNVGGVNVGVR